MAAQNMANTKADLYSSLVQREITERATLLPLLMNASVFAVKGAKEIRIPKLSQFTAANRAFGVAGVEAVLTDGFDTIALDQNKQVLFAIDRQDELQSSINYEIEAISRAASAHGRAVNDEIITEWEAVAGLDINGGAPADITAANILQMREFLMLNNADMNKSYFVIAPDQERVMLGLAEFSRYEYRGGGESPVVNGIIGSVYGVPVVVNTQVKAQQAFMVNMDGCGYAFQQEPRVGRQNDVRYGSDAELISVDQLFGIGGLQLGEGSAGPGLSPYIAKLTT